MLRLGNDLYVRYVKGCTGAWFRGTQGRYEGPVQAGGVSKDVTFAEPGYDTGDQIDAAYRAKYHCRAASIVGAVLTRRRDHSRARSYT